MPGLPPAASLQVDYLALYVNFCQKFPSTVILTCDVIGSGYKFPLSNNSLLHNDLFHSYLPFIIILACTIIWYPKVSNLEMCNMLFLQYIWWGYIVWNPSTFFKGEGTDLTKNPKKGWMENCWRVGGIL